MEGIKEASSYEEARVLLEKRKEICPLDDLINWEGPVKKKSKKKKSKAAEPVLDIPLVVEDVDEASFESVEAIF